MTAEVKVVPVEPTAAMIDAADTCGNRLAGSDIGTDEMTRHIWSAMLAASPPAEKGEGFTSLDGLWKDQSLSRLDRVKAYRFEFGDSRTLAETIKAVDQEAERQRIAALSAQSVSPSEGEAVAWRYRLPGGPWSDPSQRWSERDRASCAFEEQPLYTHPASDQSDTERMRAAANALVNEFAWSAVKTDCEEARVYLQSLIDALRAALAEKAADQ